MLPGAALSSLAARFWWPGAALWSLAARFCWQGQHFRLWTVPERVWESLAARFCWQGQHFRLWTPRGSFLLAGAALQALDGARARFGAPPPPCSTFKLLSSLAARFCWQGQQDGARPLDAARRSAALWSFAARFCWQGQHFRLWTVPERVSGPPLMLPGAALSSLAGASRLVSAGRGSTSGSGRCPSAFRGPPPLDAVRRSTLEPRGLFCAGRGSTSGSAFRGPPPLMQHFRASRLVSAGRGSTSGSGRCPSAFRGPLLDAARRSTLEPRGSFLRFCWQGQHFRLPPLDAARRSTFEPRGSFLLAGAALQALDGARARFGAPPRCCQAQHFGASGRCPSAFRGPLPGAALSSLAGASRLVSGAALQALDGARAPPPSMLPGAALWSLFCWQRQHFRLWTVPSAFRGPSFSMLPGAALWSLAARFCWQGQHFRLSGRCPSAFRGPPP